MMTLFFCIVACSVMYDLSEIRERLNPVKKEPVKKEPGFDWAGALLKERGRPNSPKEPPAGHRWETRWEQFVRMVKLDW